MSSPAYRINGHSHAATDQQRAEFDAAYRAVCTAMEIAYFDGVRLREHPETPDTIEVSDADESVKVRVNGGRWVFYKIFIIRLEIVSDMVRAHYGR